MAGQGVWKTWLSGQVAMLAAAVIATGAALPAAPPPAAKTTAPEREPDRSAGCPGGLVPVCRRVPTTRKKLHVEYDLKCEPVCVPGCGLLGHHAGECRCGSARVREKKTLLKKVTEQEIASHEYKIFWVCRACAFGTGCCGER